MFKLIKYLLLIFTLFYLINSFDNYSYTDLALHEIISSESCFGETASAYISMITNIFNSKLKDFSFGNQKLDAMIYLGFLRLSLPVMLCFKGYCLFSLFTAFCLLHQHKKAYQHQLNMHFQKVMNKYLLFIAFYVLIFLLFTAAAETIIYVSYLLPLLIILLIKACFLYTGFPPYF